MNNGYEFMVQQLIERRHEMKISQEELSFRIGCAKSLIHKWEQFKRQPSGFMLGCWVDALGMEITVTKKLEQSSEENK